MTKYVSYVFLVLGAVLVSTLLWVFVMGGSLVLSDTVGIDISKSKFQKQMWYVAEDMYREDWDIFTGGDGRYTAKLGKNAWDSAVQVD